VYAFHFGPFIIAWLHFAQGTAACFLPAVLYQIDVLVERRTLTRFVTTAAIGATVVFCGHPETAVHILLFAIAYVAWIAVVEKRRDFLPALAGAGAVAVLLALPIIVPFAENVRESTRFESQKASSSELPFSDRTSLALLVQPRLYGTRPGNPWGPAGAEAVTGFAGILGIAGLVAAAIEAITRRRFRDREFFFVIAALGVLAILASVRPLVAALHAVVGLAANARLRFIFAWILAVLIAAMLDRLSKGRTASMAAGLTAAGVLLALVVAVTPFPGAAARRDGMLSLIPSILVLTIGALALVPRARRWATILLVVASIAELWPLTIGWNPAFPRSSFFPRTPLIDAVLRRHRPGFDRVSGIGGVLFPNTNAMFGIEDARIHDPMEPARYVHQLDAVLTRDYYKKWIDENSPLLDRLNVRWVLTEPGRSLSDTSRYALRYSGADGNLYENLHVLPRFFAAGARVRIISAAADAYTLDIDAAHPTHVESSVGWSRWWRTSVNSDGTVHAVKAGDARDPLISFHVPAGHSVVDVRYVPTSFNLAAVLSLFTAVILACFMIRARVQRHLDLRRRALRDRDRLRPALESERP